MATTTTTGAISAMTVISRPYQSNSCSTKPNKVYLIRGLNAYGGLKPVNKLMRIGVGPSAEEHFASIVMACKAQRGGGALTARCSVGAEVARVVPIMSGLVLVGIALGFVLLRIEAAVEESQAEE